MGEAYEFSNGVRLYRRWLLDSQLERYEQGHNLHEPLEEEWLLRNMEAASEPEPVFLDIGAAVGYYSILVRKRWPHARVIAVDPLPRHLAAIREHLALNCLEPLAVRLMEVAVAPRNGVVRLADQGYSSRIVASDAISGCIRVPGMALKTLLKRVGPIHLLKMDIQGTKARVLRSGLYALRQTPVMNLIIGTHGNRVHRQVVKQLRPYYTIEFSDPSPLHQPDGIVIGSIGSRKMHRMFGGRIQELRQSVNGRLWRES